MSSIMSGNLKDEARLLFTVDVLSANIPSLVADLGSTKYAMLSFSEKSRNEVKQKIALLPAVSATFSDLLDIRRRIQSKQEELTQFETQLVRAAPPRFVSAEEQADVYYAAQAKLDTSTQAYSSNVDDSVCSEDSRTQSMGHPRFDNGGGNTLHGIDSRPTVVLPPEQLQMVREVEALCESEREELIHLSKETNGLEDEFDVDRASCEEMTGKVQSLKWKYEKLCSELHSVKLERSRYELLRSEHAARRVLRREGLHSLGKLFSMCRCDEFAIIKSSLDAVQADFSQVTRELEERRAAQEMDLAVYQIAYKEQQAAAEALKDEIAHLRGHAYELAILAKEQEVEEARRNCVRRLVRASLNMSDGEEVKLTAEQRAEVLAEHERVCAAAARIGLMEEQRRAVAAALMRVTDEKNGAQVRCALRQTRDLLREDIILERDTVREDESG